MRGLTSIPEEERYNAAFTAMQRWRGQVAAELQKEKAESKARPLAARLFELFVGLEFIGCIATMLLQVPPATYLIDAYTRFFDTSHYSVMLLSFCLFGIVLIPTVLIRMLFIRLL